MSGYKSKEKVKITIFQDGHKVDCVFFHQLAHSRRKPPCPLRWWQKVPKQSLMPVRSSHKTVWPMRPAYLSNAATLGNVEEPPSCMAKTLIGEHGKPTVCDPLPKKAARSGMHSSWAASWTERKSWKASSWALKRRSSKGACAKAWRWQSLKFSCPFPRDSNHPAGGFFDVVLAKHSANKLAEGFWHGHQALQAPGTATSPTRFFGSFPE